MSRPPDTTTIQYTVAPSETGRSQTQTESSPTLVATTASAASSVLGQMQAGVLPRKRAAGLYTIIFIKLGKGLVLLALALGIFSLVGDNLAHELERFLRFINVDPEQKFFLALGQKLQSITPDNIRWIASGTMLYALLLFVEGIGLTCRAWWAMWLAIGETAFFIPVEVYELMSKFSAVLFGILAVNVLIVAYLVRNRNRLFHHRH